MGGAYDILRKIKFNQIKTNMATQPEPSKLFTLGWKDIKKGIIMAAIGGALAVISPAITAGTLFTVAVAEAAGYGAAAGIVSYLIKNFFTNSNDEFLTKESKQ